MFAAKETYFVTKDTSYTTAEEEYCKSLFLTLSCFGEKRKILENQILAFQEQERAPHS